MAINKGIGLVGVALQSDAKTPATTPTYVHGLTGGSPFGIDRKVSEDSIACGVRAGMSSYVESIDINPSFTTRGYADALGLYLFAVLGNDVVTSVASETNLYKHTFTMGSAIPSLTIFGQIGADNFTEADGCKVTSCGVSFSGNQPADFSLSLMGLTGKFLTAFPGSIDPSCFDGYFAPTDGTFKISTFDGNPADAVITDASVEVSNDCESFRSCGSVMASSIGEKKCTVKPSFTVVPDDITPYRELVTGSADGTTPTGKIVYGSYDFTLTHTKNAKYTLRYHADMVPFTSTMVEVDPGGGSGEFSFAADNQFIASKAGSPVTIELTNGVAKYTL